MTAHSPNQDARASGAPASRSLDAVFDALADRRRRRALRCVADGTDPMTLTTLTRGVATRERDDPLTAISTAEMQAIETSLNHVHVPKLAAAGALEYDREHDLVTIPDDAGAVWRILECVTDDAIE